MHQAATVPCVAPQYSPEHMHCCKTKGMFFSEYLDELHEPSNYELDRKTS